jgi:hypothetical protein
MMGTKQEAEGLKDFSCDDWMGQNVQTSDGADHTALLGNRDSGTPSSYNGWRFRQVSVKNPKSAGEKSAAGA